MTISSIKKYKINRHKTQEHLSSILTKTRIHTSKIVRFRKHVGQILRERIPVISPLEELISGRWFISGVSIIKYSLSRWGRVIIIGTEWIFVCILILYWDNIIKEAARNLSNIIFHFKFPKHISIHSVSLMVIMSLWTIWYYGMIKPWDFKQAIKEYREEYK